MVRPTKHIPRDDIKGLKTLLEEGKSQDEIAAYFSNVLKIKISQQSISNKIKELNESEK